MRRPRAAALVNIAPLLDVILLLLLFVMLNATFTARQSLRVELPQAATATAESEDALTVALDAEGHVLVQDEEIGDADLAALLAERGALGKPLRIAADHRAASGALVRLMDRARAAGIKDVRIATRPEDAGSPR